MNHISALHAHEDYFGPPSEPILAQDFLEQYASMDVTTEQREWNGDIVNECRVDDLKSAIENALSDPATYAYLIHSHEKTISTLGTGLRKTTKRKRYDTLLQDVHQQFTPVSRLREGLDSIQLKCWPYANDSAAFVRPPKNSYSNALTEVRASAIDSSSNQCDATSTTVQPAALIFISVYSRLAWGNHLGRNSQHVLLSSQTLGDLYEVIPCSSNEIAHPLSTSSITETSHHRGGVMCVEGVLYGDGQSEDDYAEKLLRHLELISESKRPSVTKGTGMHDQDLASLVLRINQPYWLVHQGNCEHFLVVDHIRLMRSDDKQDGYPLTVFVAAPVLDLCQGCSKVPATLSITGDLRLGQSPCKLCQTCWVEFGYPTEENVLVVPLCKYQLS